MAVDGKSLSFLDFGATMTAGFYHNIDDAVATIEENVCDIWETVYDAAFMLCRLPDVYQCADRNMRMYFKFDIDKKKYVQEEEPKIFN